MRPRSRQRRPGRSAVAGKPVDVAIETLGAQGDGVARDGGKALYVPFTLPGDRVRVRPVVRRGDGFLAEIEAVLAEGPGRAEPVCPLFGKCGGCALQHLDAAGYAAWKRDRLAEALARKGLGSAAVEAPVLVSAGTRRRVTFSTVRRADGIVLGFNARLSHQVIDVERCPLLTRELDGLIGPLRGLLGDLLAPGQKGQVRIAGTLDGPDILFAFEGSPNLAARQRLALFAEENRVARLSWRPPGDAGPETVVQARVPRVDFSGVAVEIPPGAFLQPSREGERALVDLVTEGMKGCGRVLDLYSGLGTFAFALSGTARVHAVEADPTAVAALTRAAGRSGLGGRITAEVRDLGRRPLAGKELAGFDGAVFDPPRAGAAEQAAALAGSEIGRVVAVSCNPSTLTRDARFLVDGGFRAVRAVPVDQFTFAAHVEAVMVFER